MHVLNRIIDLFQSSRRRDHALIAVLSKLNLSGPCFINRSSRMHAFATPIIEGPIFLNELK